MLAIKQHRNAQGFARQRRRRHPGPSQDFERLSHMLRTVSVEADLFGPSHPFLYIEKVLTAKRLGASLLQCTYIVMHPMASCAPCEHVLFSLVHACTPATHSACVARGKYTVKFTRVMFPGCRSWYVCHVAAHCDVSMTHSHCTGSRAYQGYHPITQEDRRCPPQARACPPRQ